MSDATLSNVTPSDGAAASVVEVKRTLDGREQRFETELVQRTPSLLLVLYRIERGAASLDSYGCFWPRRPYSCYHMVRPPGAPDAGREVVSRFDVVRDVAISSGEVRYLDLLLDLWVRDGKGRRIARWEDEDELAAALRDGLLDAAGGAYVARARRTLQRRHRRVVGEIRGRLRALGRIG